jgi:hypothetical protein
LRKVQTRSDSWYLTAQDAHLGPVRHAFRPEFHLYLPKWVNLKRPHRPQKTNLFVWAYGDSHGGVAIQGMTTDQEFSILGPSTSLWLEIPAPSRAGVLILTPTFRPTHLDDILDHWEEVLSVACDGANCEIDDDIPLDPGNCADCVDNDLDGYVDVDDLFCQHRPTSTATIPAITITAGRTRRISP